MRKGPYVSPKGPYPHIIADSGKVETMMWVYERPDGGRSFGFTGGHTHTNWGDVNQRKVVLNALLWIAKVDVPASGVEDTITPGPDRNLDDKGGSGSNLRILSVRTANCKLRTCEPRTANRESLLKVRVDGLDGAVGAVLQLGHLDVAQVRLPARQLAVVVEEVPLALEFDDRVVVRPAEHRLQDLASIR